MKTKLIWLTIALLPLMLGVLFTRLHGQENDWQIELENQSVTRLRDFNDDLFAIVNGDIYLRQESWFKLLTHGKAVDLAVSDNFIITADYTGIQVFEGGHLVKSISERFGSSSMALSRDNLIFTSPYGKIQLLDLQSIKLSLLEHRITGTDVQIIELEVDDQDRVLIASNVGLFSITSELIELGEVLPGSNVHDIARSKEVIYAAMDEFIQVLDTDHKPVDIISYPAKFAAEQLLFLAVDDEGLFLSTSSGVIYQYTTGWQEFYLPDFSCIEDCEPHTESIQDLLVFNNLLYVATSKGLYSKKFEDPSSLELIPELFILEQNFPNPFNPTTTIRFELKEAGKVSLEIFNIQGRVVRLLTSRAFMEAGSRSILWDGLDDRGQTVAAGIYFYRLTSGGGVSQVRKMTLLK